MVQLLIKTTTVKKDYGESDINWSNDNWLAEGDIAGGIEINKLDDHTRLLLTEHTIFTKAIGVSMTLYPMARNVSSGGVSVKRKRRLNNPSEPSGETEEVVPPAAGNFPQRHRQLFLRV